MTKLPSSLALLSTLLLATLLLATATPALSQSQGAVAANAKAYELYIQGNYEEAAAAYKKLLQDYPTDILVPVATMQLGFANFFLTEFDEALAILEKVKGDETLPDDLKPIIASFIPQVLSAQAQSLPADDPKRKEGFRAAIAKFDEYLQAYAFADQVEQAMFGKALALFQLGEYQAAADVLLQNISKFPNSPSIQDSENLLSLAYATMGSLELAKGDSRDLTKGFEFYDRAEKLLRGIIDKKTNLTLVNDARFQLAEILFSKAAFSPEDERPALYRDALDAYRAVVPNEQMIAMQREKMAGYPERRRSLLLNPAALKAFEREAEREQRRLAELQGKPDMISTAGLKMAEIYFNQRLYNHARVVIRHMFPFLSKPEDKKRAQYFLTMTYLVQNVADAAKENYEKFQAEYEGDPIAQNLPLAMGNMFLSHPDPNVASVEAAIKYFDESLALYPDGTLAGLSVVSKASAQTRLGDFSRAEATFTQFLSGNPTPDEEIVALTGLADIYKVNRDWAKANETYAKVVEKFSDRPQALDAQFWIAMGTKEQGDNAKAIELLEKAIADHPEHALVPTAMFYLGRAKTDSGDMAGAIKTFSAIAEKFPDSIPAPYTFFTRMQILMREGKRDEADTLMKEFIEKYPEDDKVFAASEILANNAYQSGRWEDAIAAYDSFAQNHATSPRADSALLKVSEFQKQWAESLGRYGALNTDLQAQWKERMEKSIEAGEKMVSQYPESLELAMGIQNLVAAQQALVAADIKSKTDLEEYFKSLADGASDASVKSKILFGLASWIALEDEARALATMREAYNPDVLYAPADLDTYGLALLRTGDIQGAQAVFAKLAEDYPTPEGVAPNAAPPQIQQAQAIALFGRARIAQENQQTTDAGKLFSQLKELYPWSPKVLEAELGIAEADFAQNRLDETLFRLPGVIRAPSATADLRAKAMLLGGQVMKKKAAAAFDDKARQEAVSAAIDYFIKIDQFYSGVPSIAAEGLFEGSQMLEQQSASSTDPTFKKRQLDLAKRSYQDLLKKYPSSPFAAKAQERLNALGN